MILTETENHVGDEDDAAHVCGLNFCDQKVRVNGQWFCPISNMTLGMVESGNPEAAPCKRVGAKYRPVHKQADPTTECSLLLHEIFGANGGMHKDDINSYTDRIIVIYKWAGAPVLNTRAFAFACLKLMQTGVRTPCLEIRKDEKLVELAGVFKDAKRFGIKQGEVTRIKSTIKTRSINKLYM